MCDMADRVISDEVFERVLADGTLINREKHRKLMKFDRKQMERYIASIYRSGYEDGITAVQEAMKTEAAAKHTNPDDEYEEVSVGWEDVMRLIAEVKGATPELLKAIDERLRGEFG